MNVTDNQETASHLRTANSSSAPAESSAAYVMDENRIKFIRNMSQDDIISACQMHPEKFKDIHASIIGQFQLQNSVSDKQMGILEEFVLQNVPEVGPKSETNNNVSDNNINQPNATENSQIGQNKSDENQANAINERTNTSVNANGNMS